MCLIGGMKNECKLFVKAQTTTRDASDFNPRWRGWGFLEFYEFNKLLGLIGIREKEYYQGIS